MAFSKAARFPSRDFSTPGPGSYSPSASPRLSGVPAYTFGQRSRRQKRATAMLPTVNVANLQLAQELGRGGMGTVRRGSFMGELIAVKTYRYDPVVWCDPEEDRKGLVREALRLQRLDHPNVVQVVCLVSEKRTMVGFGMEQLGESLARASDKGRLSGRRLARAFRATCEAVAYIHGMLVAHLDIKESNLCCSRPWSFNVKVIDFDAAMELKNSDDTLNRFPGTFEAASPERKARQPCRAVAEDYYMTGYAFLNLLTKTPPDRAAEFLRARVMPLLRRAEQRPSVQQILQTWNNPIEAAAEPAEPLPTLLASEPANGDVLTKLFQ
ncbi:NUAK1 [Symbiodinium sp. CCMP2592]|nr:NUAK1 [Symbiodinium sp. CCMP2592]